MPGSPTGGIMKLDQVDLLTGILTGLVVWAMTGVVVFIIRKNSLDKTLLEHIKFPRSRLIEYREYISLVCDEHLREGERVEWYAYLTKETPRFFNAMQSELFRFYFAKNLIGIVKFYDVRDGLRRFLRVSSQT